jgi:hypothetical protein
MRPENITIIKESGHLMKDTVAKISRKLLALVVVPALIVGTSLSSTVSAATPTLTDVTDGGSAGTEYRGQGQPTTLFDGTDAIIPRIINVMLFIVGILAVIMLIYGGIRYVISGGQNERVTSAKNTILYAIVGLIVAILGYAVVGWIVGNIGDSN